jgi:uncharacterized membrane-anchored protein YhcB (DUF1043 family)
MKTKFNPLDRSMEKYKAIQEKQINAFETELMPDIESLNFERAAVFADLKNNLDHFSNIVHDEPDMALIVHYQNQLEEIMKTDARLKKRITQYKNELKQHMSDTSKSKIAFHGYKNSAGATGLKSVYISG